MQLGRFVLVAVLALVAVGVQPATASTAGSCKGIARGWGDNIRWSSMEEGLLEAATEDKPIMVIIHKTWCGACKRLAPLIADSKSIADISANFVMINCEDDEEPGDAMFKPDGAYFPRVLFMDPNGRVDPTLYNAKASNYKYYYSSADMVREGMQRALGKHKHGTEL